MSPPSTALEVFAAHAGCASTRQLVTLEGVTHNVVAGWRRRGWTEKVHHGVDRLAGAPRTDEQALWGALLRCGEVARAGPRATCWAYGLEGFGELQVDVVLPAPHRCRGTSFPARTRLIGPGDRATVRGFPCLSAARAIIEVAHALDEKALRVLIDSARRGRYVRIEWLKRRANALQHEVGSRRGAIAVLRAIGTGTLDKESENEREIEMFLATTDLQLEWQNTDLVPGRRLDAVDREARLAIEIDSRLWHDLDTDRDADHLRDLEVAEVAGYRVVHITLGMVRHHGEELRQRLNALRAQRVRALVAG